MSVKNLMDLVQRGDEARSKAKAITEKAETENRGLTPDEQTQFDAIMVDVRDIGQRHANALELMSEDEKAEARSLTAGPQMYDPATTRSQERAVGLGEFCMAVRSAEMNPGGEIPNFLREARSLLGQSEQIPADGGYLLQPEKAAGIQENMWTQGTILSRCTRRTLAGNMLLMDKIKENSREDGSRYGSVSAYWEAEGDATTASQIKFEQQMLPLNKMMALVYASDEVLADVPQLESKIMEIVPKEMTFKAEDGVIRGLGAGQMWGILGSGSTNTIAKETEQDADTIVAGNVDKMWKSRHGTDLVWLYNQELEDTLATMVYPIGTAGEMARLFVPPQNPGAEATIKGRPAFAVEQCSGPGDVGDFILADLSQYIIGEKTGGIQTASSIHVQFLTGQNTFRFTWRITGQPMNDAKITPYKRTASDYYIAPFNIVAAR